jgi:hypothetical protein
MKTTNRRFGGRIQCGATVVEIAGDVVLAHWEGNPSPWVVWRVFDDGPDGLLVGSGYYCATLASAVERFAKRCGESCVSV